MGRNLNPKCKQCRRAGQKLFLKGERCHTPKCALTRRPYAPGARSKRMGRGLSEYGKQLLEKQKVKKTYGLLETQFKNYVLKAIKKKGDSRDNLVTELETRLDNVIFRFGISKSRETARQLVSHGLVKVNGRRVNIPSFQVKAKDVITFKDRILKSPLFANLSTILKKQQLPAWLVFDAAKMEGKIVRQPSPDDLSDLTGTANLAMVIEYYSR